MGLNTRKYGAASAPQPAVHCQPSEFCARSASTSVSQNQRAPSVHGSSKSFTRNDATIIRTRLCIQPVAHNSRIPASTMGYAGVLNIETRILAENVPVLDVVQIFGVIGGNVDGVMGQVEFPLDVEIHHERGARILF